MKDRSSVLESRSPLLLATARQDLSSARPVPLPLAEANPAKPRTNRWQLLQATLQMPVKLLVRASHFVLQEKDSDLASQPAKQRLVLLPVAQAMLRELFLRPRFCFCRGARADVCEVLAHAHFPELHWPFEDVIARRAAAVTPFSLDICRRVFGAHLLAVTVNAAVRSVDARAALEHSRLRSGINICAVLVGLRIEMSDLPIWKHGQSHPRERERAEDSEKERGEAFH